MPAATAAPSAETARPPRADRRAELLARVRTPAARAEQARVRDLIEAEKPALRREMRADLIADGLRGDVPVRGSTVLLKAFREDAGVSLTDLAAKAGMQKSSLSRLENQDRNPTVRTLERIAAALGKRLVVRVEDLPAEDSQMTNGGTANDEATSDDAE